MTLPASEFLGVARPFLEQGDGDGLRAEVCRRWRPGEVAALLEHPDADARRVAALTVGLVGSRRCVGPLSRALHDADALVHQLAENALWSIWFRSGSRDAAPRFEAGLIDLGAERYDEARAAFRDAAEIDPEFAEAYNQCAISDHFLGRYAESLRDCERAVAIEPVHFGAMAGMGHNYAHLGRLPEALDAYRRALAINPRMEGVRDAVRQLERELSGGRGHGDGPN